MKVIWKIAKTELQMLFYSPIAWLLLLCFVIQTASFFTGTFTNFVTQMENNGYAYNASYRLFIDPVGNALWNRVQGFLYFYIPLLTMGVVSKELSSGSIKLLYSSPISNAQIILGKFLAMVVYSALLVGVLLIYVIVAWCTIENFEAAWVLTGLLGLFLLTCTYMAVGIFVSSLTTYQIIAAVGTFVVLMLLSMVGGWGQQYDFVRDITYWLCIDGRASTFIQGMICSEDLLYFPVITAMFLSFTIIRLNAVRQKQKVTKTLGKYGVVLVSVCVIAFVSSRPALLGYIDTTTNKVNTLTSVSQEIIKQAKGGMTITSYVNVLDRGYSNFAYPGFIISNRNTFRRYTRFKPEIKLKVVYYYADIPEQEPKGGWKENAWERAKDVCEFYGIDSMMLKTKEEVDQMVDLSEEGYSFVRQIVRESGEKEFLRVYNYGGTFPDEAEISAAIKRTVMKLPRIAFVKGHRERDIYTEIPQGYSFIGNNKRNKISVWNQGFDVIEITLQERVPEDVDILIIGDMRTPLSPEEEVSLQDYIDRGGSLFVLGEPSHREVQNPMLRKFFGLELTPLVVGEEKRFPGAVLPNVIAGVPTSEAKKRMYHIGRTYRLAMPTASAIEQVEDKGFQLYSFVETDTLGQYWTELETTDFIDDTIKFNPAIGEVSKKFSLMVGMTRMIGDKEQRILVSGDADCLANNEYLIQRGISSINFVAFLGAGYWLSHERAPIDDRRPGSLDNRVFMSVAANEVMGISFRWGLPILLLGGGIYIWLKRRGR